MLQRKSVELPISSIRANPEQPRKHFAEEELNDLKNSIAEYGVLQPIIVKKDKTGFFFLIAGERRLRAAKLAGLTKIPALIKDFDDKDTALIAVVENVQRENLSYIEEAYAYRKLIDDFGLTQGELSDKIGKRQSTISNKLRILTLPPEIQEKLIEAKLPFCGLQTFFHIYFCLLHFLVCKECVKPCKKLVNIHIRSPFG